MKNILLIFKNCFRRGLMMFAVSVAAALFMIFCFYSMSKSSGNESIDKIKVGIIDSDDSTLSADLKKYLSDVLGMELVLKNNYDDQSRLLIDKNISAIIEVPQDFYSGAATGNVSELIITTLDDYENAAFIEVYLNSYMQSVKVLSDAANGDKTAFDKMLADCGQTINVSETKITDERKNDDSVFIFAMGFILMMISVVSLYLSVFIISDRQNGTHSRILCSPIKPVEYIVGMAIFSIICGTMVNVLFSAAAYSIGSGISIPQSISLAACELYVLFSTGLSILLALLIKSTKTLFPVGIGYTTFSCMLGGAWFPINDVSVVIDNAAKLVPQYWFMNMLRESSGVSDYNFTVPMCILALFALLVYLISAVIFSRKSS